jgi:hypothetical protein
VSAELTAEDCEKLYLTNRRGKTHLYWPNATYPSQFKVALCGTVPEWGKDWLGLNSEKEKNVALSRRICGGCERSLRKINRDRGISGTS